MIRQRSRSFGSILTGTRRRKTPFSGWSRIDVKSGVEKQLADGRVNYEVNAFGNRAGTLVSSVPLDAGKSQIVLEFIPDQARILKDPLPGRSSGPGVARLTVNGKPAGEAAIANFVGIYGETLDIGSDLGSPVSPEYTSPFAFTGHIETVTLELRP